MEAASHSRPKLLETLTVLEALPLILQPGPAGLGEEMLPLEMLPLEMLNREDVDPAGDGDNGTA